MLSFSKAALLTNSTALLTAWVMIDDCGVMTWLTIAHILLLLYILNMNFAATSFRSKCEIICLKIEKSSFSNLPCQISSINLFAFSVWSIRKKIEEKHYLCTLEEVAGNLITTDIQILFPKKVNFGLQLNNPMHTKSLSMCYSMWIFTLWLANLRLGLPACQSFIYQVLQILIVLSTRIDNVI